MADEHITCGDCGQDFVFSDTERAFYVQRSLAVPPKRCKPCRDARKQSRGPSPSGSGAPGGRFAGNGGPPRGGDRRPDRGASPSRRYSGDVNEYRSPMAGPDPWGAPAQHSRDRFAPPGANRPQGDHAGDQRGNDRSAERRGPPARQAPAGQGFESRGPARADGPGGPRRDAPRAYGRPPEAGGGEYRSPAFPGERAASTWGDARPARRGPGGDRAHGAPPRKAGPPGPAQPKPRKPRPTFDIVCGSCGETSNVPFQPEEGRDIFCQPCYQARRDLRPEERTTSQGKRPVIDFAAEPSPADHTVDDSDMPGEE